MKKEKEMKKEIAEEIRGEISGWFINESDNTDRFVDNLIDSTFRKYRNEEIDSNSDEWIELYDYANEVLHEYPCVGETNSRGDYTCFFYDLEKKYETVDEFMRDNIEGYGEDEE